MLEAIASDIKAIRERDPAARHIVEVIFCYSGLWALLVYRISHKLWSIDLKLIARFLSTLTRVITGVEIHPGAKIGKGFFIDHGTGVVIGETAIIGENVTIYHGATLGGTSPWKGKDAQPNKRHPTVADHVVIGAGAKILGPINVGSHALIGSNAVITHDVDAYSTMVAAPGRPLIKKKQAANQDDDFHAYGVEDDCEDPYWVAIQKMQKQINALEKANKKKRAA